MKKKRKAEKAVRMRGYEDFTKLRFDSGPVREASDELHHDDPLKKALVELRDFIKQLREAHARIKARIEKNEKEVKQIRDILRRGGEILSEREVERLRSREEELVSKIDEDGERLLLVKANIYLFTAMDMMVRDAMSSGGKLAVLRRIIRDLSPLPTIVRLIFAVLSMVGVLPFFSINGGMSRGDIDWP